MLARAFGLILVLVSATALGHGGGLDERGCHRDSQAGDYHCHKGPHAGKSFPTEAAYPSQDSDAPKPGEPYDRELYRHWIDADGDCQDTRTEVLIAQAAGSVELSTDGCEVVSGKWRGPYTGDSFRDPSALHIDHVVPLKEAHISGAKRWSQGKRERFANDPDNLLAVEAGANMSKGSDGPADWLPEFRECHYIARWVSVKEKWDLAMDRAEQRTVERLQNLC